MSSIMHIDLEVQNKPYFGAVASPRHPDNFVVMNGYAVDRGTEQGPVQVDHYKSKEEVPQTWLHIPDDTWLIVAHNAPFEMDWFLHQQRDVILPYLKRGGRIWCTAYAEYLLSNQLDTYPALDEVAPRYGGTPKIDGVKILWEQGVLTADIDPALLKEYLGGDEGDVANTRKIFYGQYAKLNERGMLNMAFERMEGMVYNCLCMDAGLKVDRKIAFDLLAEQVKRFDALGQSFQHWRSHIPDNVEFKPTSDYHMSAWLFGGPIKFTDRVPALNEDGSPKYEKADFVKDESGNKFQLDESGKVRVADMYDKPEVLEFDLGVRFERYKAGKNKGLIKVFREDTATPKLKNAEAVFNVGPLVDLNLLPEDIRKEFLQTFAGKRHLADGSPVISTGKDCLDMLAERKEFPDYIQQVIKDLQEWARLDKDIGTYYLRETVDDSGQVTKRAGMLQYLTDQDYVHHLLNVTSTVTGRLSSNRPNFQNLPRGDTSDVKKMFTSRFGKDGFIVEADYTALEVVTLAAFSKDKALCAALVQGTDMHCMRLAKMLNEPYEDVLYKAKTEGAPDHEKYSVMRTLIKPRAFAYQYGATAAGIAFSTGCSVQEAQDFIDTEKALFPEVEAWYEHGVFPVIEKNSSTHREQYGESWSTYRRGFWQSPGGTCYDFREYPKTVWAEGQRIETMQFKPTQMRNYPIQGESGFFVQGISGLVMRWLIANDFFPDADGKPRVYAINTVHDALYLDVHKDVLDVVAANVKAIMESLPTYFNQKFGYDLQVPFPAAVEFGRSMYEKIHWHEGVLNEPAIRERLGWEPLPLAA